MEKINLSSWRLAYAAPAQAAPLLPLLTTVSAIQASGLPLIDARVPGNFELDLMEAGLLPKDIYFGTNILKLQAWENTHLWYFTTVETHAWQGDTFLRFGGIDTAADIYFDGEKLGETENMLIPHEFELKNAAPGTHELVVHVTPACEYAQRFPLSGIARAQKYNRDSLVVRKAPYMYGWDIMCRNVSAGLWREVTLEYRPASRMENVFIYTSELSENRAVLLYTVDLVTPENPTDLTLTVTGRCGDHEFSGGGRIWGSKVGTCAITVSDPVLWWPRNYGEPALYDTVFTLSRGDEILDEYRMNVGIRTVFLDRTSCSGENGTFRFVVNGKPIMVLGTNWVPTDSFPSRHDEYTLRGLELVKDVGCNMIRAWGGNAYPSELFYDYCDKNGLLVWQDFAMACGIYPTDERSCRLMREEAESIVREKRSHACLALWSGDNECDCSRLWFRIQVNGKNVPLEDPNDNILTRKVLPGVLAEEDLSRSYLPSSPYYDAAAFASGNPSEDHLWGPRDYFKGQFYKYSRCHFVSETGYHGSVSPESLKKFISPAHLTAWGDSNKCADPEWLCHAASPEVTGQGPWVYRIPLMMKQIERLFGRRDRDLYEYALSSQISQAEAMKFFIEKFRLERGYRWGIIWWNIIDGWPQQSDAVVDWYGCRKLAYHYIRRSQQPVIFTFTEPDENGETVLTLINDSRGTANVHYTVKDALTGKVLVSGDASAAPDTNVPLDRFDETGARFLLVEWAGTHEGKNHFVQRIGDDLSYEDYTAFMKSVGFDQDLEGFKEA